VTTTLPDVQSRFQRWIQDARLVGTASVLLLSGCGRNPAPAPTPAPLSCAVGDSAVIRETLYFGRNRPGGSVSDTEWQRFLTEVVTPRFPQGLTVLEASGQWQGAAGVVEQERSQVVTIFHPDNEIFIHFQHTSQEIFLLLLFTLVSEDTSRLLLPAPPGTLHGSILVSNRVSSFSFHGSCSFSSCSVEFEVGFSSRSSATGVACSFSCSSLLSWIWVWSPWSYHHRSSSLLLLLLLKQ